MPEFVDRVTAEALNVRPAKAILTVLAVPFYVLGWVIGLLWVVVLFAVGAIKVGILDAKERATRTPEVADAEDVGD